MWARWEAYEGLDDHAMTLLALVLRRSLDPWRAACPEPWLVDVTLVADAWWPMTYVVPHGPSEPPSPVDAGFSRVIAVRIPGTLPSCRHLWRAHGRRWQGQAGPLRPLVTTVFAAMACIEEQAGVQPRRVPSAALTAAEQAIRERWQPYRRWRG